jgi:hypothetical protein
VGHRGSLGIEGEGGNIQKTDLEGFYYVPANGSPET